MNSFGKQVELHYMIMLTKLIGEINKAMIMNGITQIKVAELSGLSRDAVNKLLTGSRRSVNTDTLFAVMNALELHIDNMMLEDNEYKQKITKLFNILARMSPKKREKALILMECFITFCMEE